MALTTDVQVSISGVYTLALDLVTKSANLAKNYALHLDTGTGLSQGDVIFSDQRTMSGLDSLDMTGGGLLDNLGNTWAPARIKGIFVFAAVANSANVLLRRPATNGVPWLTAAGDEIIIVPGGFAMVWAPSAAGFAVTAGTGDLIDLAPASGTLIYDIIIIGASA